MCGTCCLHWVAFIVLRHIRVTPNGPVAAGGEVPPPRGYTGGVGRIPTLADIAGGRRDGYRTQATGALENGSPDHLGPSGKSPPSATMDARPHSPEWLSVGLPAARGRRNDDVVQLAVDVAEGLTDAVRVLEPERADVRRDKTISSERFTASIRTAAG